MANHFKYYNLLICLILYRLANFQRRTTTLRFLRNHHLWRHVQLINNFDTWILLQKIINIILLCRALSKVVRHHSRKFQITQSLTLKVSCTMNQVTIRALIKRGTIYTKLNTIFHLCTCTVQCTIKHLVRRFIEVRAYLMLNLLNIFY